MARLVSGIEDPVFQLIQEQDSLFLSGRLFASRRAVAEMRAGLCGSGRRGESHQFLFGENAWMLRVSIERRNQRCSFTHDTNPRMMMAMPATFMVNIPRS